ncbi:ABC transporter ATP-binding protein [Caldalkalibacillus mannanilyticus]|uniref:ABC transporter ATP-binding protein n=1 Tax=Caldalkalibacillus mannanilyticus TaxID=1418 RepID=UPI000468B6D6|nr:ABC transporter ATP-binding protein [Caldalkalibacillus mannanilyticus]
MINVDKISKSFDSYEAVSEMNLTVKKGSIYGLLGSNGAGKTTLLKMLVGIYKQDSGTIKIKNEAIYENLPLKQVVVFIPDALYFLPQSTIKSMADFYSHFYANWNQERFEKLQQVFEMKPTQKIQRLSKGMQRQVSFWLALSCMPEVLILDEPLDGLDPVMRQKIKNLLFQEVAEREMTIMISSHNLREIEDICDHVGIMHKGKLIVEKDLDDLKADTHKIQIAFSDKENEKLFTQDLKILHTEKRGSVYVYIVKGNVESIKRVAKSVNPLIFDLLPLTLEEIFVYEMGGVGYEIENVLL